MRICRYEVTQEPECPQTGLIDPDESGISLSSSIYMLTFTRRLLSTCPHQRAVEVMCFVPKRCNDMMNVGRLQGFQVSVGWFHFLFKSWWKQRNSHSPAAPGQDHRPGEAAPAGHLLCQRAGKRRPVQSQREEGLPLRAAGHFQRAPRQEERRPHAGVHLQKQHQGEPEAALVLTLTRPHAPARVCCQCPASPRSAVWEWRSTLRKALAAWC